MPADPFEARPVSDHVFRLAENPLWDERAGVLYWADIDAAEIWALEGETTRRIHAGDPETGKVGGFTLQEDGSLLLFRVRDVTVLRDPLGAADVRPLLTFEDEGSARFNDVFALPDGSVLAGTIGRDDRSGGVFHLRHNGTIVNLWRGTGISNGIALTADGFTLYWTCSTTGRVFALPFDPSRGVVLETPEQAGAVLTVEDGTPDGLTLDADGHLWQARWGAGMAVKLDPNTWRRLAEVRIPAAKCSSVAFGGPDLDRLYITSSEGGVYVADMGSEPGSRGRAEFRSAIRVV